MNSKLPRRASNRRSLRSSLRRIRMRASKKSKRLLKSNRWKLGDCPCYFPPKLGAVAGVGPWSTLSCVTQCLLLTSTHNYGQPLPSSSELLAKANLLARPFSRRTQTGPGLEILCSIPCTNTNFIYIWNTNRCTCNLYCSYLCLHDSIIRWPTSGLGLHHSVKSTF